MPNPNTATIAPTRSTMTKIVYSWTSTAGGAISIASTEQITGYVVGLETIPDGTDVPTDLYDLEVRDDYGTDIFNAEANNRSSTTKQFVQPIWQGFTVAVPVVSSKLTLVGTNAGASKSGTAILYVHHTK